MQVTFTLILTANVLLIYLPVFLHSKLLIGRLDMICTAPTHTFSFFSPCSSTHKTNIPFHIFNHLSAHSYSVYGQMYLLHCPCHQYRVFPWLHDTQPLSILIGRCSASRWLPECIVRYCCRDLGNPLGTGDKHTVRKVRAVWVNGMESWLAIRVWNRLQPIYMFEGGWRYFWTGALKSDKNPYFSHETIFMPKMQRTVSRPFLLAWKSLWNSTETIMGQ